MGRTAFHSCQFLGCIETQGTKACPGKCQAWLCLMHFPDKSKRRIGPTYTTPGHDCETVLAWITASGALNSLSPEDANRMLDPDEKWKEEWK